MAKKMLKRLVRAGQSILLEVLFTLTAEFLLAPFTMEVQIHLCEVCFWSIWWAIDP